jgi:hypothetical protein
VNLTSLLVPVVSALVLCVPGLVLGLVAGLRPATAVTLSPLGTYGLTTVAATVATYASISWSPVTLVLATLLGTLAIAGVRLATGRRLPWRDRLRVVAPDRPAKIGDWAVPAGVVGGGVLSAGVLLAGFGRLGAPNQDWDYMFHANAVRLIADSGDVAPEALRQVNSWETADFYYPNSFHAVAAVGRDLSGGTVFEALNSQALLVCLVTGAGLAALLLHMGAPRTVAAATPVLLAGFASFPYDLLWRGPLLPYAAGIAVVPAFVLLVDLILTRREPALLLLGGLAAAGLLGLHPSIALSSALFLVVHLALRWVSPGRAPGRDLLLLAVTGVVALLLAFPAVLGAVRSNDSAAQDWPAVESPGQAFGDLLLLNHGSAAPQYWLAGLVLVGILAAPRSRYMWAWLGGTAIVAVLFIMSAAFDNPTVATLTAPWWNDRWRFAGLAVLGLAPLAASGLHVLAVHVADLLVRLRQRKSGRNLRRVSRPVTVGTAAALGLLLVGALSQGLYAPTNEERMTAAYGHEGTLSRSEVGAMRWLADRSTGGTVMNDSNDGSAYLSAVAGLRPLFGHVVNPSSIPYMGPTQQALLERFNCLDRDADVREAVEDLNIRYVFVSVGYVRDGFTRVPGLLGLADSPSLDLVYDQDGTQIYEVDLIDEPTDAVAACRADAVDQGPGKAAG